MAFPKLLKTLQAKLGGYSLLETSFVLETRVLRSHLLQIFMGEVSVAFIIRPQEQLPAAMYKLFSFKSGFSSKEQPNNNLHSL